MGDRVQQEEIFSQVLRAGRRTYFFDVISERHQKDYKKEEDQEITEEKTTESFTDVSFDDI